MEFLTDRRRAVADVYLDGLAQRKGPMDCPPPRFKKRGKLAFFPRSVFLRKCGWPGYDGCGAMELKHQVILNPQTAPFWENALSWPFVIAGY